MSTSKPVNAARQQERGTHRAQPGHQPSVLSLLGRLHGKVANLFDLYNELRALPEATIRMSGNDRAKRAFEAFTKPHPKYRFIQNKRWGIGLLPLADCFDDYLKGKNKQTLRTNRRRAMELGFRFARIDPQGHLDDILAINTSMKIRQGRPLSAGYTNVQSIRNAFKEAQTLYGIIDPKGALKAYAHAPICGEVFVFSTLLGHGDDLDKGIMYLLISEVIRDMIEHKRDEGQPLWAMYDTFFGAQAGLRYFKERLGFKPYKVYWVWDGQ